jgi:hypothetical protein
MARPSQPLYLVLWVNAIIEHVGVVTLLHNDVRTSLRDIQPFGILEDLGVIQNADSIL